MEGSPCKKREASDSGYSDEDCSANTLPDPITTLLAGGPIWQRSTCAIARLVMIWWDEELLQVLVKNNLITDAEARYMDVIRIWLWSIRMGWMWTGQALEYCKEWREEDRKKGLTPLQKTTEILQE